MSLSSPHGRGATLVAATGLVVVVLGGPAVAALPPVPVPPENPITEEKRALGKILFWDEQLSGDNTMACATCHQPARGGADGRRVRHPGPDRVFNTVDDTFGSPGVIHADADDEYVPDLLFGLFSQVTDRSANSMILAAYSPELFWDGRARGTFINPETGAVSIAAGGALESQAVGPPLSGVEMAHAERDWGQIAAKLRVSRPMALGAGLPPDVAAAVQAHRTYPRLFEEAFGDEAITAERIAFAIATYERTLIADDTPFDRWQAGQANAMTPQQVQGFQAFQASNCAACHTPPMFTDQSFRNIGLRPPPEDPGRRLVTNNPADRGKFKTPSLRNVGLRTSFMHNGQFTTIPQVIGFYAQGPNAPPQFLDNRDPIMPLVNVPPQVAPLIDDFIRNGLTDARVANQVFPFDRPQLFSQRPGAQPAVVAPGTAGSGAIVPRMIAVRPPVVGDMGFRVGLDRALGGSAARVLVSTQPPVDGRLVPVQVLGPVVAGGVGSGTGFATAAWPIRANPALNGREVYVQWVVDDPGAAGGEALSAAVRLNVFCGPTGCAPCPGDWDRDAVANSNDISAFLTSWLIEVGGAGFGADFSGDGFVNSADISGFVSAWLGAVGGGC